MNYTIPFDKELIKKENMDNNKDFLFNALRCIEDGSKLKLEGRKLICQSYGAYYQIDDDIPIMTNKIDNKISKKKISRICTEIGDNEYEDFYNRKYANVDVAEFLQTFRQERLLGLCNLVEDKKFILDIGCANGGHLNTLYKRGIKGIGIDVAISNLKRGKKKFPYLYFVNGFAEKLPFAYTYFDTVIMGDILEHLRDPGICLKEAIRVSRDGIVLCIPYGHEFTDEHIHMFTPETIRELFNTVGLQYRWYNDRSEEISDSLADEYFKGKWMFISTNRI